MSCIKCGTNVLATAKTGQCEKFKDDGAQTDRGRDGLAEGQMEERAGKEKAEN